MANPAGFVQHVSGFWQKVTDQSGPYSYDGTNTTLITSAPVAGAASYPAGATPVTSSSGNVAAASAVATLPGVAGKTTYCTGFQITGGGATAGSLVLATLAGLISGTATYVVGAATGAAVQNTPLTVTFNPPIPASGLNTAIVLTLPSLGAGNTNAAVSAQGFQL